jgi:flagellar export protein FliJ
MKRFVFRLETLLRHRVTLEALREQEFALAQGHHETARLDLVSQQLHLHDTVAQRPGAESGARFDAPAILARERYVESLQLRIARQVERVELARLIAEETRVKMVAAKQAREAATRLRDKDHADYLAEDQRKTQESLDEIATVRFVRQRTDERARA